MVLLWIICIFVSCVSHALLPRGHRLGKGLTSWLLLVMFIVFLLLSHVVSWVRCDTWLYLFLIFVVFLTFIVSWNGQSRKDWYLHCCHGHVVYAMLHDLMAVYVICICLQIMQVKVIMSPPGRVGRDTVFPLASVGLFVTKSRPLYNLLTVKALSDNVSCTRTLACLFFKLFPS